MKILVLQHARDEHPGIFRAFLDEDGHSWTAVHLDEGEALPASMQGYDALWVLGGPMDVWQEEAHPWLVAEKAFIRRAVIDQGYPFLGMCLGHQLLAEAVGGSVGLAAQPEIGILPVNLTEDGASGVLFDGIDATFPVLQWHSAMVTSLPSDCKVLATTEACPVQAFSWQTRAHGVQFHLEVENDTIDQWAAIPEYAEALVKALGPKGTEVMRRDYAANVGQFLTVAERFYMNWMQCCAKA